MKLLLFGGTFDPPHKGHLQLLKSALDAVKPDKVIVMPAGIPPHKAASATPGEIRMAMCRCFEPLHPMLEISDWEIEKGGKSYTIDTVNMLCSAYPDAQIFICVGSDMLTSFTQWKNWQQVLQKASLVVHSRHAGDFAMLQAAAAQLEAAGGKVLFTHGPVLEAASSQLRKSGANSKLLVPLVQSLVKQYHLYER